MLLSCIRGIVLSQITTQYFHADAYKISDGLGHGTMIDYHVDHNGLMWIYTSAGLQLFDGKNFSSYNYLIKDRLPYAYFDTYRDDHVYFLYGNLLMDLDDINYTKDSVPQISFPPSAPECVRRNSILYENDRDLFVWHCNDSIYQVDKTTFSIRSAFLPQVKPAFSRMMHGVGNFFPKDNKLVYLGEDHVLYTFDLTTGQLKSTQQFSDLHTVIFTSRDTIVCLGVEALYIYSKDSVFQFPLPAPNVGFGGHSLLRKNAREVLVSLESNIYAFDLREMRWSARYQKAGGGALIDIRARKMVQDQTGNLYFGTFNDGFVHLHPHNPGFNYIGAKEEGRNFARRVHVSDEHHLVLMGTLQDGLYVFDTASTQIAHYLEFPDGKKYGYISDIIRIDHTHFLILTERAFLLTVTSGGLRMDLVPGLDAKWLDYYNSYVESYNPGIHSLNNHNGLLTISVNEGVKFNFYPDHPIKGAYAISKFNGGYISFARGTLKTFDRSLDKETGSFSIPVTAASRCMIPYDSSHVLLGTDAGLYLVEMGKEPRIVRTFYDKVVYAILPGHLPGEFWFSTDYGLFCLQSDPRVRHYSKETGLQENEFNTQSCVKSSSGKLYFGGVNGITAFYPSEVSEITDHIIHYITQVSINNRVLGRYLPADVNRTLTTTYSENNITIDLLGRGIKSPKSYNYQYRMDGLANSWVNLGTTSNVNFHLAPGRYKFYYLINDNFDPDALPGKYLSLHILQPFYKRWWFIAGIITLAATLFYMLYKVYRKRELLKISYEKALNHNLQRERMRISRELHDNIGAQMATVKRNMNFLVSNSETLSQQQIMHKIQDLEGISTQINQELRDTIWATQHEHVTVQDFISRIKSFVFQTLGPDSAIRVHYSESADEQLIFGPFVTLNLHRICQEALNNIVKHSGATDIYISFENRNHHFVVTIRDNGNGFDAGHSSVGYGLQNMHHRAKQVGADLIIDSKPGQGTKLEITVNKLTLTDEKT